MSEKPYPSAAGGQYAEPPPPYPADGQMPSAGYPPPPHAQMPPPGQFYPPNPPPGQNYYPPNPPGQGYYPPNPPPTTTYYPPPTTTTTTVIVAAPGFGYGPHPVNTQCPNCHAQILTETRPQAGTLAWLICICCVFFGFIFGCCLIPFCIDDLQDVEHRCPQCKQFLGSYRRL